MSNIRCKVCDYTEDQSTPSLFHNSTTDGYARRRWVVESDGPVCDHCTNPPEELPEESDFALLDDWPAERTLIVADLHLEKASFYARLNLRPKVTLTSEEWQKRWSSRASERAAANSRWDIIPSDKA